MRISRTNKDEEGTPQAKLEKPRTLPENKDNDGTPQRKIAKEATRRERTYKKWARPLFLHLSPRPVLVLVLGAPPRGMLPRECPHTGPAPKRGGAFKWKTVKGCPLWNVPKCAPKRVAQKQCLQAECSQGERPQGACPQSECLIS